jgi:putative flippase GtrA
MARRLVELGRTFARYVLGGGLALLVHLAVLTLLVEVFSLDETLSSAVGFLCAVPVNFLFQYRFVFRSQARMTRAFARYAVITAVTLGLNTLIFWLLITVPELQYVVAQLFTTAVVLLVNFYANSVFTFAKAREQQAG